MNPRRGGRGRTTVLVALILGAGVAYAQVAGGDYTVKKSVIAGGSATNSGGDFRASTTIGQADAGSASGGDFRVQGGFWPASGVAPPTGDAIFCDGFEDSPCAPD